MIHPQQHTLTRQQPPPLTTILRRPRPRKTPQKKQQMLSLQRPTLSIPQHHRTTAIPRSASITSDAAARDNHRDPSNTSTDALLPPFSTIRARASSLLIARSITSAVMSLRCLIVAAFGGAVHFMIPSPVTTLITWY